MQGKYVSTRCEIFKWSLYHIAQSPLRIKVTTPAARPAADEVLPPVTCVILKPPSGRVKVTFGAETPARELPVVADAAVHFVWIALAIVV